MPGGSAFCRSEPGANKVFMSVWWLVVTWGQSLLHLFQLDFGSRIAK
jgi:hypothetical protein